jgi:hypothetical protein
MAERRPLTAGLSIVPPGAADQEAVRAFVTQERKPERAERFEEILLPEPSRMIEGEEALDEAPAARRRKGKKAPVPVGLIPVTVRLKPEIAAALKRASLERQLAGEEVYTQQDLVELALEPWLRREGFLG